MWLRAARRSTQLTPASATSLRSFWIAIPEFIVGEANLGLLGLGVAEPLPSWGNLLKELENYQALAANPWRLAPLALLVPVMACFQVLFSREDFSA